MVLCDVNVLLHALFAQSPLHEVCSGELRALRSGSTPMAFSDTIAAAVVRIATNPRIYSPAAGAGDVLAFLDAIRTHERAVHIAPGPGLWRIFRDLITDHDLSAGDVTDAYLAALAIDQGCTFWTTDRGFSRFSGLQSRLLGA